MKREKAASASNMTAVHGEGRLGDFTVAAAVVPRRRQRLGPEADLVNEALVARLPTDSRLPRVVFREPELPTGYPDIVAVYPSLSRRVRRMGLCGADSLDRTARLLSHIYSSDSPTFTSLKQNLLWTELPLVRALAQLTAAGLVELSGEVLRLRPLKDAFALRRIVAIEAKIGSWRAALKQAAANTWFASHSYILIPQRDSYENVAREARLAGVGVLVLAEGKVVTVVQAEVRPIPASYGSWLLNEWTLSCLWGNHD